MNLPLVDLKSNSQLERDCQVFETCQVLFLFNVIWSGQLFQSSVLSIVVAYPFNQTLEKFKFNG
ncbi:hypothetical protein A33Q_0772 [Indibacter alkaliphilus LW1]|uniref:Uncharacterized protein n=1 Tax=Indibacter alkaliphilus (strain CCUG 57479 / KCTC 22604 / LW1) TaxID=1189612 RepID=S2DJ56_INDAL|nr:hypothetical protein A33Q_0772 [Indibacter alkaliphilus LW1]